MPTPNKGETQDEFISRCVPIVIRDDNLDAGDEKDRKHAVAKCFGIWRQKHGGEPPTKSATEFKRAVS